MVIWRAAVSSIVRRSLRCLNGMTDLAAIPSRRSRRPRKAPGAPWRFLNRGPSLRGLLAVQPLRRRPRRSRKMPPSGGVREVPPVAPDAGIRPE